LARNSDIRLRRSATAGAVPTTAALNLGELAINTYDGKIYLKKDVSGTESIVEIGASTDSQEAVWKEYVYTATSNQTSFSGSDDNSNTLSYTPLFLQVFLNGVLLDNGTDYTATSGSSVVLVNGASASDLLQIASFVKVIGNGDIVVNSFTGDGSTAAYTLTANPDTEDNTTVFVDGVYQEKDTYAVSGTTLTFDANVPNGASIEILIGSRNVTLSDIADLNVTGDLTVDTNTLYVDSTNNRIGIGTTSPSTPLELNTISFEAMKIRRGTSGTDASVITFAQGDGTSVGHVGGVSSGGLQFRTGSGSGTERARIDASGNVGIGTSGPLGKLHVRDGSAQAGISHTYLYDGSAISIEATEPAIQLMAEDSGTHGGSLLWRYGNNAFAAIANPTTDAIDFTYGVTTNNDFNVHSGTNMSSYLKIMSIGADGNVGIGTSSPATALDVRGGLNSAHATFTGQANRGLVVSTANTLSNDDGVIYNAQTAGSGKHIFQTAGTERLRIDSSGNVGIGTAIPSTFNDSNGAGNLVVGSGSGSEGITVYSGTTSSGALCFADGTTSTDTYKGYVQYNHNTNSMQFATGHTERLRIDSSGNVGIGTSSPNRNLHIIGQYTVENSTSPSGALLFIPSSDANRIYSRVSNASSSSRDLAFLVGSTEAMRIDGSTGNVGIGTTAPAAKLQVEEYGIDTTETSTTAITQVAIHTMAATTFRSARFTVQVTNSTDSTYHLTEILMIHDGTTPSITEYGTIFTGSAEATFDADISSGNVRLLATPASTDSMEFKVICHSITV
jgi:hypothetical protein